MRRMTLASIAASLVVAGFVTGTRVGGASSQQVAGAPVCDVGGTPSGTGIVANAARGVTVVEWNGAGNERLRIGMSIVAGVPTVKELAIRRGNGAWVTVASDARMEFKIVEGFRRISNQQLVPLRELGVPLTPDVINKYKWDVFWDAPLDQSRRMRRKPSTGSRCRRTAGPAAIIGRNSPVRRSLRDDAMHGHDDGRACGAALSRHEPRIVHGRPAADGV